MSELLSAQLPPSALIRLEEEAVSNGLLPDIMTGFDIEGAQLFLAGLCNQHGLWLGTYDEVAIVGPTEATGFLPQFEQTFRLKSGARDVVVHLLYEFDDQAEGLTITVQVESQSVVQEKSFTVDGSDIDFLEQARYNVFDLYDVGLYPGEMANYDVGAIVRVIPTGANARLWSLTIEQTHTAQITQEDGL